MWDLARKQIGACLKMSNYGDLIMDTQTDQLLVIYLILKWPFCENAWLMTRFIVSWHTGKVEVCFLSIFWKHFGSQPCSRCIFCVEHEPIVSDVYEQVVAAESLSRDSMTSKVAWGNLLVLLISDWDFLMHLSQELCVHPQISPVSNTLVPLPRMPSGV